MLWNNKILKDKFDNLRGKKTDLFDGRTGAFYGDPNIPNDPKDPNLRIDPIDPPGLSVPSISEFPSVPQFTAGYTGLRQYPPISKEFIKRQQQQEALRRVDGFMGEIPTSRKFGRGTVIPQQKGKPLIPYGQSFDKVLQAIKKRKQ